MLFPFNKKIYVGFLLAMLFVSSCTKILDDELTQSDPKLVVNAVLSPDSAVKVNLSKSIPIFANESTDNLPFIESAAVKFYQDGQFLFQLDEDENGYYQKADFTPLVHHAYSIEVEKEGFPTLHAETHIPNAVPIESIDTTISIDIQEEFYQSTVFNIDLTYTDPPGVENYYRLDCYLLYTDEEGNTYEGRQWLYVDEAQANNFDRTNDYLLWNDLLTDGQHVTIHFNIYLDMYQEEPSGGNNNLPITYKLIMSSVDKPFYQYDVSRSVFYESGGSNNPFSEPVVIYSNIENGLGIFGGFSSDTTSFNYSVNLPILSK